MGAKEPPVLHILIHSIFGTRKGTNISVLNSFPSTPVPYSTSGFRRGCPVFHLWPLTATATPHGAGDAPAGLGLARVLVAHPGAPARPPPRAELSCAPQTPQVLRGGGVAVSYRTLARAGGSGDPRSGEQGRTPVPAIAPGTLPMHGATAAEKRPCLGSEPGFPDRMCVCVRVCACEAWCPGIPSVCTRECEAWCPRACVCTHV